MFKEYSNSFGTTCCICTIDSPLGKLVAAADEDFLYFLIWENSKNIKKTLQKVSKELSCQFIEERNKILCELEVQLSSYFQGKLKQFSIPLKLFGSDFQMAVWNKLQQVPYASTKTYGEFAQFLGCSSSHARAIGAACGANTHFLIVPCHRIVATGSKGGFSCGIDKKEWLLKHEKNNTA